MARAASKKAAQPVRTPGAGKGKRTSLAVRAAALVFALALAALAARLWLGGAGEGASSARGASGAVGEGEGIVRKGERGDARVDVAAEPGYEAAPPLHAPHSEKDQEALRGVLRDAPRASPPEPRARE